MREKQLEAIEIQDVEGDIDDDTIMRFIEYAYTGDYTVPDPDVVQLPSDPEELQEAFKFDASPQLEVDEYGVHTKASKKDKKKKKKLVLFEGWGIPESELEPAPEEIISIAGSSASMGSESDIATGVQKAPGPDLQGIVSDRQKLWDVFCSKAYTVQKLSWRAREGNDQREDYTGVFLCHARLYKFSDRYGCSELMSLTLQKLRLTLVNYRLHPERVTDVVELIRYTYTHTLDHEQGNDPLRALILDFAVCYFHNLVQYIPFLKLLKEGGPLPSDLVVKLVELVS